MDNEQIRELHRAVEENRNERRADMAAMSQNIQAVEIKVDELMRIANMGRGALWALLRLGATVAVLGSFLAWLWNHITWKF